MENSMQEKGRDEGNEEKKEWVETRRKIKNRWNKLSSNQLDELEDQNELLAGQLVKTYGFSKEFAKTEADAFFLGNEQKIMEPGQQPLNHTDQVSSSRINRSQPHADRFAHDRSPYFDDQP